MSLPPRIVIEASAGTGKTFSLVTRLLTLIFGGVEPERIVALTFSRLAAGEIFNSFIERLANASADDHEAQAEAERLGRPLTRSDFAAMLRKVISRQHLSLIGTLDSFMMRVVRMMPLELGLEGEVSVLSEYRSPVERVKLVGDILRLEGDESKSLFRDAFRLAFGTIGTRSFVDGFAGFIESWHKRYRERDKASQWGDEATIWSGEAPAGLDVTIGDIRDFANRLEYLRAKRGAATFINAVASFSGSALMKPPKSIENEPDVERVVRMANIWRIARALETTKGVYRLMRAYEGAYALKVRAKGLVAFDDMPLLLRNLNESDRLALEYRMDSRFDHWALDEFQDTSRNQWAALENLINESAQREGEKSVFIVGDRKQSIYEWRGGDVRILGAEAEKARAAGALYPLDLSRRYLGAISSAVNKVFGESTVQGAFDMDDAPEGAKWRCRDHESFDKSSEGFVEVIEATRHGSRSSLSDFFEPIANALNAVEPWRRGITSAILVRRNKEGEAILAYLKSVGIDKVVFEGDSNVADSPVLSAMAELVTLAEHPTDAFAYAHIRHSPLADALWPAGMGESAEVSASLLADFTRFGMVRKFREAREALKRIPDTWNDFTESRFEDFIKCAAEFEQMRDAKTRLSDFTDYLANKTRRDFAEPGVVRIMTMHQSKGLGFDHVIIPFYENDGLLGSAQHAAPLECESPSWILQNPGHAAAMSDNVLAAAERRREHTARYNALCLDYVAMTRAKKALTIILHPRVKDPPSIPDRFSDLVRMVGLETSGDREWYLKLPPRDEKKHSADTEPAPTIVRRKRRDIPKVRPSESYYTGLKGDALFADDFGAAAKRGTEAHAEFEKIEWLAADKARTDLERALVKPSDEATVWRERAYELFMDGKWESGQFDRVVFWREGGERRAAICDYKTNARRAGESLDAFTARMQNAYRVQMLSYRAALAALTGIPQTSIQLKLLLVATQTVATIL